MGNALSDTGVLLATFDPFSMSCVVEFCCGWELLATSGLEAQGSPKGEVRHNGRQSPSCDLDLVRTNAPD